MRRTVKVSLDFATKSKRKQISGLLREYRAAVNFYIKYLWTNKGSLNKETLAVLENTRPIKGRSPPAVIKGKLDAH